MTLRVCFVEDLIGESENELKTKKVPFVSFSNNSTAHFMYLLPRFDIYFRIFLFSY